jgi:hypothetical protein
MTHRLFWDVRQQSIGLGLYDPVTLAATRFQTHAIEYGDVAATVLNQSRLLQLTRGLSDTFTAHATCGHSFRVITQLVRRVGDPNSAATTGTIVDRSSDVDCRPRSATSA